MTENDGWKAKTSGSGEVYAVTEKAIPSSKIELDKVQLNQKMSSRYFLIRSIDNKNGIGQTSYNMDVDYFGTVVMMKTKCICQTCNSAFFEGKVFPFPS